MGSSVSKRIVITGSTRGIGNGLAREFLKRDCSDAISARSADAVDAMVAELGEQYGAHRVTGAACDITDPETLQRLWDTAVGAFGGVDIWINNAGMSIERKPLWQQSDEALAGLVRTIATLEPLIDDPIDTVRFSVSPSVSERGIRARLCVPPSQGAPQPVKKGDSGGA